MTLPRFRCHSIAMGFWANSVRNFSPHALMSLFEMTCHNAAISGVQAGSNGNFGLVIGVARKGNAEELTHHGANLVVNDLAELVG